MKSLAKNTIFNVIYRFIALAFPLVTASYVARILLPEGVGRVSYAQNIASYFILFASLGIPTYGIKVIAEARDSQVALNRTFTSLFVLNLCFTAISSACYIILINTVPAFRNDIVLYWACGLQVFFSCIDIDWLYSGREEYAYIVIRSLAVKILALISLFIFVRTKDDYICYALITSIAMVGNYVFNVIHARKYVRLDFKNIELKKHLAPIMSYALMLILGTIYNKIDVTMLGIMATDDSVGLYSNAHKVIDIIVSTCAALTAAFLPRLAYYFSNRKESISDLLDKGVEALCLIVIPSIVGIVVIAPSVTTLLFGSAFFNASITMRVLAPVIFFRAFGDLFCYQLLVASGNEKKRIGANLASSVLNIVLNAILIPIFKENGAAIASVLSEGFVNIYLFVIMKKQIRFHLKAKPFVQAGISSAIMLLGCIPAKLIHCGALLNCAITVVCCCTIYLAANIILKNHLIFEGLNRLRKMGIK